MGSLFPAVGALKLAQPFGGAPISAAGGHDYKGRGQVHVTFSQEDVRRVTSILLAEPVAVLDLISSLQAAFDKAWPEYAVDQARAWPNA